MRISDVGHDAILCCGRPFPRIKDGMVSPPEHFAHVMTLLDFQT